jgi:2-methylcitrate dehydratase PrpD
MNVTEWITQFVRDATPDAAALTEAAEQLARFHRARAAGAPPAALNRLAADSGDPMWTAWVCGATAAAAGPERTWVAVCAAATALGESEHAVPAVAIGSQVADRVAEALGPMHTAAGWDVRATAGGIGAVAAAGWLYGLDQDALRHALGLCATQAAGLACVEGTDAGALQVGKAAANAIEAALLGQCGFTSSAEPLGGRRGLFALMTTGADDGTARR